MKITLSISLKNNLIIADSPETAFHTEFANVVLMEKTQNKLMGMGVSLEEAERTAPKEFAAQKQNLVVYPAFSKEDFQVDVTYTIVHLLAASACFHNRTIFSALPFGIRSISCNLSLPGYEQIPKSLRDQFEYQLLSKRIIGTKRKVTQLIINNQIITELNQDLDKKEKRYQLEQRLSNLLIGTFMIVLMGFFLWLMLVTTFNFRSTSENGPTESALIRGIGAFIVIMAAIALAAYISEVLGTLGGLAILRCFLPSKNVVSLAKKRNYSTKSVKRIVEKFFIPQE